MNKKAARRQASWANLVAVSCLSVFLWIALSCAPAPGGAFERGFAEGARAESAGRFEEAARGYDHAAQIATRARDRDQARWDAAEMVVRLGNFADGFKRMEAIANDAASEHRAEAAYRAALLLVEHGDAGRGWREMDRLARAYPSHGVAHVAIRKIVAHADDAGGARAGLDTLRVLDRDLAATEAGELVAFLLAEHLETLSDAAAARDAFARVADRWPYPFGAFFDDALWRASLLDEKLGRTGAAVADLDRMVRERETTTLMGSYERPRYVPAMLRLASLYRDRLADHARARDVYHRLYTDFAHSAMRDDALWLEASLWRDDGDAAAACDRLATLVKEFPDSRYVPCAVADCGLSRPDKSAAPRTCHAYITRARASNGAADP